MFFGLFWGDTTILVLIPAMIFAFWAQIRVNSTFKKYAKVPSRRGLTGAEAARRVLDANGLRHVTVERVHGHLTDHFDPKAGVIRLSDATYASTSVAAIGVAAHEAGHAVVNFFLDNTASGGRRLDIEMASRGVALWRTDYQSQDLEAMQGLAKEGDVILYAPENSSYMMGETELYYKTLRDIEGMNNSVTLKI